jgi:hypothetical protein
MKENSINTNNGSSENLSRNVSEVDKEIASKMIRSGITGATILGHQERVMEKLDSIMKVPAGYVVKRSHESSYGEAAYDYVDAFELSSWREGKNIPKTLPKGNIIRMQKDTVLICKIAGKAFHVLGIEPIGMSVNIFICE